MAKRYKVTLTQAEREQLSELTRSGKSPAAKFVYARALLLCDAGEFGDAWKVGNVAAALGVPSLRSEVCAWQQHRTHRGAPINWRFTTENARIKLPRLYPKL